jgi:myosin heavy subunit
MNTSKSSNPESGNSRQRLFVVTLIITIILLGVNAFLLINKFKQDRVNEELTVELDETKALRADLQKQYHEALTQLDDMKGSNEELNQLIERQKSELMAQKSRIDQLLSNKGSLDKARAEIKKLNGQVESYLAEINQLRRQNQELAAQNEMLSEEKEELTDNLDRERQSKEEIAAARAALSTDKERLEREKASLATKVDRASAIEVQNIELVGLKTKSDGKTTKKNYANNIDQLQVCFNTTVNDIAEPGRETYYIRIINPSGETLNVEELGSGAFKSADSGKILYTTTKDFTYQGDVQKICTSWGANQTFVKGKYTVEIYNKGYRTGTGTLVLK